MSNTKEYSLEYDDEYMTVNDAFEICKQKSTTLNNAVHRLILMIQKKIRLSCTMGAFDIIYHIPSFIEGVPQYDTRDIQLKLVQHFRSKGFWSRDIQPNMVYVSWRYYIQKKQQKKRRSS